MNALKQNNKNLKKVIRNVGCFFRSAQHIAELKAGKVLTAEQINDMWNWAGANGIIKNNNMIKGAVPVANRTLDVLGCSGKFYEVGTFQDGKTKFYPSVKKGSKAKHQTTKQYYEKNKKFNRRTNMSDLNRVSLIGNLVRNAELKYTANGKSVSNFSIAVNGYKNQNGEQEVSFFDIVLWNSETRHQYLKKGIKVAIDGVLKQERWKDDGGRTKTRVVIIATNLYLLSKKEISLLEVQDTSGVIEKADESDGELDNIPF